MYYIIPYQFDVHMSYEYDIKKYTFKHAISYAKRILHMKTDQTVSFIIFLAREYQKKKETLFHNFWISIALVINYGS
jgi:hypothetical protein